MSHLVSISVIFRLIIFTDHFSLSVVGEAKNPRKTVPKTIRRTFWRLLIFYVGSIFVVGEFSNALLPPSPVSDRSSALTRTGLIVKATDPELKAATKQATSAAASPFVLAITRANIKSE